MYAKRMFIIQILVLAFAGLILAASIEEKSTEQAQGPVCKLLCDVCKQVAQSAKMGIPQAKDKLEALCQKCGAQENVDKCKKVIDEFIQNLEKKSPEEICTAAGFCKNSFLSFIGL